MYVMQISTHSPESCPAIHEEYKKGTQALLQQLDSLMAKHGVKLAGSWNDLGAHTIYNIYDTPSLDAYWAFLSEPQLMGWIGFNMVENRVVLGFEEIKAMLGM